MDQEYQNLCKMQENKLNKQFANFNKKILAVERNMVNKIKLAEKKPSATVLKQS